tara:strand:- start:298 stop:480 length:183 start_codon:yes stop_codon:yes gene_type:complete
LFPEKPGDSTTFGDMSGVIKESYANFGLIPYGHSMVSKNRDNWRARIKEIFMAFAIFFIR